MFFRIMRWCQRYLLPRIDVYTDGSFKHGKGAWAFVIALRGRVLLEAWGTERKTNSLTMEIRAAEEALRRISTSRRVCVYTDCRILIDAMTVARDRNLGAPRYQTLLKLTEGRGISWRWIKAHAGHPMNERCDTLCLLARS